MTLASRVTLYGSGSLQATSPTASNQGIPLDFHTPHAMSLSARLLVAVRRCTALDGARQATRYASTSSAHNDDDSSIKKSVFISQSTNVFVNLALEHWLYRNFDFSKHHVLLLWRNDPCIVIGRHQNPWLECNVQAVERAGIALARRNSGGGTVYHDNGNLNLTFFTPRSRYNRRYNLNIITNALFRQWGLKSVVNEREDILVNGDCKVSYNVTYLNNSFIHVQ